MAVPNLGQDSSELLALRLINTVRVILSSDWPMGVDDADQQAIHLFQLFLFGSGGARKARKTTKTIDGTAITGWFVEDFTLAELKTLRARERIPAIRPANVAYNGQFEVPTLQEVIDLAKAQSAAKGRVIEVPVHRRQADSTALRLC